MRCSEFREHHCAYVDDTLAGVELVRMQRHVAECGACSERDTRVRRSLMLARSLPHIEPSADFARKLEAKLRECREQGMEETACTSFRAVAVVGAMASLLMLAYVVESRQREHPHVARDIVLAPVVAMADMPESEQPEIVGLRGSVPAPGIIASVSAGIPIWPAALLAEQGALHFAGYQKRVH